MRTTVYAGSFDPITNGHLWMIEEGAKAFDKLVVAIGVNPDKKYSFSLDERVDMIQRSTRAIPNVEVDTFENQFLVNYAASIGAQFLLRGIRSTADFNFEKGMYNINRELNEDIGTHFLLPVPEVSDISSSLVKGLIGPDKWESVLDGFVPSAVYNKLLVQNRGLETRWNSLWDRLGVPDDGKDIYEELVRHYGCPERDYHNMVHLAHILQDFDEVQSQLYETDKVEMALWFHDAIYDTKEKDNEEKSALLAQEYLTICGADEDFVNGVSNLILQTKHSEKPSGHDAQYFVDIDLGILGQDAKTFDAYEREVRFEYSWVPDEAFNAGRGQILGEILARDTVYCTKHFQQKYESQARENLLRSLSKLGGE